MRDLIKRGLKKKAEPQRTVREVMKQYGFHHDENLPDYLWVERLAFEWQCMRTALDEMINLRLKLTRPK